MLVVLIAYMLQNSLVEHKEPKDNETVSYFIEAAGDIFRELTFEKVDGGYICEKIKKLNKFKYINIGDMRELQELWIKRPEYKDDLLEYLKKVGKLADAVDKTDFGDDIDRKEQMLRALKVIETIIDFGVFGSRKAEDDISRLEVGIKEWLSRDP